ncbi:hypothetical protein ACIRBX_08205 [Kitasatospora sp. NPDC096147]|uniref:hypothetical protein n=1 Tax=Kitasatospora sp. NPDC096147 TaxID=3364093 RepID=UPI0037F34917
MTKLVRTRTIAAAPTSTALSTTAATAAVLLAVAGPLVLAPAAFAADGGTDAAGSVALSVQAPAAIGFAGQPVEFTEAVTNRGDTERKLTLAFSADVSQGAPQDSLVIDYRDQASGTWTAVPLTFSSGIYSGTLPTTITVPAHGEKTLKLRIGAPMGLPGEGATNGGIASIPLHSVLTTEGATAPLADELRTIGVQGPEVGIGTVPGTAVAGGAPIEFDTTLVNDTPSAYVNLADLILVDARATVETRLADGSWRRVTQLPTEDLTRSGAYLDGRNSSLKVGATSKHRVRVSYPADFTPGTTKIGRCLIVNERPAQPMVGTTMCAHGATVKVTAAAPTKPSPSPAATATSKAPTAPATSPVAVVPTTGTSPAPTPVSASVDTPVAPVTPVAADRLAETGAGRTTTLAAIGAALLALGAGALLTLRRRSS